MGMEVYGEVSTIEISTDKNNLSEIDYLRVVVKKQGEFINSINKRLNRESHDREKNERIIHFLKCMLNSVCVENKIYLYSITRDRLMGIPEASFMFDKNIGDDIIIRVKPNKVTTL